MTRTQRFRTLVLLLLLLSPAAPGSAAPGSTAPGSTAPGSGPAWSWPLVGVPQITRPFAPGPTPYSPGHRGVDLLGLAGEPVLAAGAGVVSYAGMLAGRGVIAVVHGSLRTTYEPVAASVRVGQHVASGSVLGRLQAGHEGCPAAACLHWGLRRGETYLNPVGLVRPGPVRLLPVRADPATADPATADPAPADPAPWSAHPLARGSARGALLGAVASSLWT